MDIDLLENWILESYSKLTLHDKSAMVNLCDYIRDKNRVYEAIMKLKDSCTHKCQSAMIFEAQLLEKNGFPLTNQHIWALVNDHQEYLLSRITIPDELVVAITKVSIGSHKYIQRNPNLNPRVIREIFEERFLTHIIYKEHLQDLPLKFTNSCFDRYKEKPSLDLLMKIMVLDRPLDYFTVQEMIDMSKEVQWYYFRGNYKGISYTDLLLILRSPADVSEMYVCVKDSDLNHPDIKPLLNKDISGLGYYNLRSCRSPYLVIKSHMVANNKERWENVLRAYYPSPGHEKWTVDDKWISDACYLIDTNESASLKAAVWIKLHKFIYHLPIDDLSVLQRIHEFMFFD